MHPADIQVVLKKAGITQKQVANELGVTTFLSCLGGGEQKARIRPGDAF